MTVTLGTSHWLRCNPSLNRSFQELPPGIHPLGESKKRNQNVPTLSNFLIVISLSRTPIAGVSCLDQTQRHKLPWKKVDRWISFTKRTQRLGAGCWGQTLNYKDVGGTVIVSVQFHIIITSQLHIHEHCHHTHTHTMILLSLAHYYNT